MGAAEDFRPRIVRWGKKHGAENLKWGRFIQAQQWGGGKSNSHTPSRQGGKTYSNKKLNKISRNSHWDTTTAGKKKGQK
jgi:hypothetical protein